MSPHLEISALRHAVGVRSIVLIGMMGAGKTSIGRRLASRLQLAFVDSDNMIEEAAQRSVREIFDDYGEDEFRDCERRVIARILRTPSQVVALGGGAWINAETRAAVAVRGISIWLDADISILLRRVRRRMSRPLLRTRDAESVLANLEQERRPIYALADIHVRVRRGPHNQVVDDLIQALAVSLGTDRLRSG
jgi:shikimate kinase